MSREWYAVEVHCLRDDLERMEAELWEEDPLGLEEDPEGGGRVVAYRRDPWNRETLRKRLADLPGLAGDWSLRFFEIADEDWSRLWKSSWRPTPLGERLLVVPSWLSSDDPARLPVLIDPGRAFGTGTHESTSLAWTLLERRLGRGPIRRMIDVGTGTGVLALGALSLDPGLRVLGTEMDSQAIPSLQANLDLNPLPASRFLAVQASLIPSPSGVADLVVSNLTAQEQTEVDGEVVRVLAPGGQVILSGLLHEQVETILAPWGERGARETDRATDGEWTAVLLLLP
jgi:ribosomal protein L11 methyltransferase